MSLRIVITYSAPKSVRDPPVWHAIASQEVVDVVWFLYKRTCT